MWAKALNWKLTMKDIALPLSICIVVLVGLFYTSAHFW